MCTSKEPTIIQTLLFFIRNFEMRDIGLSSQWSSISFVRHLFHFLRSIHPVLDLDSELARLAPSVHPDSAWHAGERMIACLAWKHALKHLWLHLNRCRRLISTVSWCCVCPILLNADNPQARLSMMCHCYRVQSGVHFYLTQAPFKFNW